MVSAISSFAPRIRRRWSIRGQVQGVGFRPFVFRLASQLSLTGLVRNTPDGVIVEGQGSATQLDQFAHRLCSELPSLAVIERLESEQLATVDGEADFLIVQSSQDAPGTAEVTVDTAICPDCLCELFDRSDRRFGYGLINCTNCGPRYSIIRGVPYDRPNTTMAGFAMCDDCRREYTNPSDRRFHAQPVACHACGPKLQLVDIAGSPLPGEPIARAADLLVAGRIVAIKGIGGFHLAVRADDEAAVSRLRRLKHRDCKPFALMGKDIDSLRRLVELGGKATAALASPQAPILLARRKAQANVAPAVAPASHRLGVMLPYTPIHHLLLRAFGARDVPLVMTSGNISDEPLVIDNAEAVERLGGLCDAILLHDRPIERCVDDSVLIDMGEADPLPVRRGRGYAPASLPLPLAGAAMGLSVGGELKDTVCVVRHGRAIVGQHLGDLTHPKAFAQFDRTVRDMCSLFNVRPRWVAHDLHPMYLSTAHARKLAEEWDAQLIGVQHHHAHAAALMAEHGETGPILSVVCDGAGYGTDGTIWGGELLRTELTGFARLARLRPLELPGGDAAAKDTRRCALALLHMVYGGDFVNHPAVRVLYPREDERRMLCQMILRGVNCATTSSAGRVFDGIAALLGLCSHNDYEAQAAMTLEAAAQQDGGATGRRREENDSANCRVPAAGLVEIDLSSLVREILDRQSRGESAGSLAALFHDRFAQAWLSAVEHAAEATGIVTVGVSGGVFCNQRLTESIAAGLQSRGLRVLRHRQIPPNDGGICFGQAAVAAAFTAAGGVDAFRE